MYLFVLVAGTAIGFASGYAYLRSQLEVQKAEHKRETVEAWDEIKRLRSQVARWVGTKTAL